MQKFALAIIFNLLLTCSVYATNDDKINAEQTLNKNNKAINLDEKNIELTDFDNDQFSKIIKNIESEFQEKNKLRKTDEKLENKHNLTDNPVLNEFIQNNLFENYIKDDNLSKDNLFEDDLDTSNVSTLLRKLKSEKKDKITIIQCDEKAKINNEQIQHLTELYDKTQEKINELKVKSEDTLDDDFVMIEKTINGKEIQGEQYATSYWSKLKSGVPGAILTAGGSYLLYGYTTYGVFWIAYNGALFINPGVGLLGGILAKTAATKMAIYVSTSPWIVTTVSSGVSYLVITPLKKVGGYFWSWMPFGHK